jgi:hypothetical protein
MHKRHYKCLLIAIYFFCQFSFAQSWKSLNGPIGAEIVTSMITKEMGNIYVFTATQRAFISEDKGKTWTEYSSGIQKLNFNYKSSIKESPTGEIFLSNFEYLYKFNNSSKIWEKKYGSSDNIEDFNFSPDGTHIYLAENRQFLISKNGGPFNKVVDWWTHSAEFLCLGNNNNFVRRTLGASGEIWKFNDDGSQLKVILNSSCCQKLFHHKKSNTIYELEYSNYRYTNDYGVTWKTNSFPNNLNFSNLLELNDGSLLSYYNNNFYVSKDNGTNWNVSKEYSNPIKNTDFFTPYNQITISKDGNIIVHSQNYTAYFETNHNVIYLELPLKEASIKHAFTLNNNDCYTSFYFRTQFTKDEGVNWNKIDVSSNDQFIAWNDGTIGILYFDSDSIYLSNDQFKTDIKRKLPRNNLYSNLLLDSKENLLLFSNDSIYISYDKAVSWVPTGKMNFISEKLKISKQNILYNNEAIDNITYSLDYGLNWNSFQLERPFSFSEVYLTANNLFYGRGFFNK